MSNLTTHKFFDEVRFDANGLVTVVVQESQSFEVLMVAWANQRALRATLETGYMHYYSRSRKKLWRKGESSGNHQRLVSLIIDCDGDTLLARVVQKGVACHTGQRTCFFREVEKTTGSERAHQRGNE